MRSSLSDTGMIDTVVVVTGAAPLPADAVAAIPSDAVVIAADGALDHALAAGIEPALLVGDLDSISNGGRKWAEANATVERHDPDKDHTDTELALTRAADLNPTRLLLLSGGGDRLDHTIAAIAALGHPSLTSVPTIDAHWGHQHLRIVHGPGRTMLDASVGTTISLIALHGRCTGVTIDGVRWPLAHADLEPGVSLGVSNEITATPVEIAVSTGVLTVVLTILSTTEPTSTPKESP